MLNVRTILHPTDFSERSGFAFDLACALARDHGARLVVLHVIPPATTRAEFVARMAPDSYRDQLWREFLLPIRPEHNDVPVEHRLEEGDPGREIARVAEELPADLIVLGTHGRTGLRRVLMGSVAEQVLRAAPCPVLTVKEPFPERVPAAAEPEAAQCAP